MTVSLVVTGSAFKPRLTRREWWCQGDRPEYTPLCTLTPGEATTLVRTGLIDSRIELVSTGWGVPDAEHLLTLTETSPDRWEIRLHLPIMIGRPEGYATVLPDWSDRSSPLNGAAKTNLVAFAKRIGIGIAPFARISG